MLCDDCHKEQACVHIQGLGPEGVEINLNLCANCARNRLLHPGEDESAISEMLKKVIESSKGELMKLLQEKLGEKKEAPEQTEKCCRYCHTTLSAIDKCHKFGCVKCAESLQEEISRLFCLDDGWNCDPDFLLAFGEGDLVDNFYRTRLITRIQEMEHELCAAAEAERYEEAAKIKAELEKLRNLTSEPEAEKSKWGKDDSESLFDSFILKKRLPVWLPLAEQKLTENMPLIRLGTVFSFRRNLAGFPLTPFRNRQMAQETGQKIIEILKNASLTAGLTGVEVEKLSNSGELFNPTADCLSLGWFKRNFLARHYPRWFFVGDDGHLLVRVNDNDHLELDLWAHTGEVPEAMAAILNFAREIDGAAGWTRTEKFGYLSRDIEMTGTGVKPRVIMHLPGLVLTGQISQVKRSTLEFGVKMTELRGEGDNDCNLFVLEAPLCLRYPLDQMISRLEEPVMRVERAELRCREVLRTNAERNLKMVDAVARAYGLAREVRLLETQEARKMLSMLWLGYELGMLPAINFAKLLRLVGFFAAKDGVINEEKFPKAKMHEASQEAELLRGLVNCTE